jgi:large subunit ribosomal protein L32
MALPKRRHSKTRGRKRRTHDSLRKVGTTLCPRCDTVKEPHTVCPNCGYYAGREVVSMEKS